MHLRTITLLLVLTTSAFALDSSVLRSGSSVPEAAAKERLHKSLALPGLDAKPDAAAAAKERLHQSLALPTSSEDIQKPVAAPKQEPSKPSEEALDTTNPAAAEKVPKGQGAEEEDKEEEEEEGIFFMPAPRAGVPCPHHKGMLMPLPSGLGGFGSMFGPIISEAARDVFGVEQILTSQMHNIFEDILSGPAFPHMLNLLDGTAGAIGSAAAHLPRYPPLPIRGPFPPTTINTLSSVNTPMFGVVITSSPRDQHSKDESSVDESPTWEQQVVISSSDPTKLQQLADLFEQQLQGTKGLGRKLRSTQSRVQPANVAQVLLVAARKLQAAQAAARK